MNFIQRRDSYLKRKYGLSVQDFSELMDAQGGACFICRRPPKTRSLHVDHIHAKGYGKFPPERKRAWVRGLLCFQCNKFWVARGMTRDKASRIVEYLDRFSNNQVWAPRKS